MRDYNSKFEAWIIDFEAGDKQKSYEILHSGFLRTYVKY
jgi:hypothetical protein